MRSVHDDDLSARARIRNAALERFGRDGFGVGLRAIAADAGVSPALVVHHFGSKAGLREACDDHLLAVMRRSKSDAVSSAGVESVLAQFADLDNYAVLVAYVLASLADGGDLARALVEQMVADAEDYLATGVANGTVKPSRDPAGRARFLVLSSVGVLLMHHRLHGPADPQQLIRTVADLTTVPALELYTQGLMTDSTLFDAVLATQSESTPPQPTDPPDPPDHDRNRPTGEPR